MRIMMWMLNWWHRSFTINRNIALLRRKKATFINGKLCNTSEFMSGDQAQTVSYDVPLLMFILLTQQIAYN